MGEIIKLFVSKTNKIQFLEKQINRIRIWTNIFTINRVGKSIFKKRSLNSTDVVWSKRNPEKRPNKIPNLYWSKRNTRKRPFFSKNYSGPNDLQ